MQRARHRCGAGIMPALPRWNGLAAKLRRYRRSHLHRPDRHIPATPGTCVQRIVDTVCNNALATTDRLYDSKHNSQVLRQAGQALARSAPVDIYAFTSP